VEDQFDSKRPLFIAAKNGHVEVVRVLVCAGANVNATNTRGLACLQVAIQSGHSEVARELVEAGAVESSDRPSQTQKIGGINVQAQLQKLISAIQGGDMSGIGVLIKKLEKYLDQEFYGSTLLYLAATTGNLDVVKLLLQSREDVNKATPSRITPLGGALEKRHKTIALVLIAAGATANAITLIKAIQMGDSTIVEKLIQAGADMNATTKMKKKHLSYMHVV
jgi:ankyrin repeat protein